MARQGSALVGRLEWPFVWPSEGWDRLKRQHPELREFVRRAIAVESRSRFADGAVMYRSFKRLQRKALKYAADRR